MQHHTIGSLPPLRQERVMLFQERPQVTIPHHVSILLSCPTYQMEGSLAVEVLIHVALDAPAAPFSAFLHNLALLLSLFFLLLTFLGLFYNFGRDLFA